MPLHEECNSSVKLSDVVELFHNQQLCLFIINMLENIFCHIDGLVQKKLQPETVNSLHVSTQKVLDVENVIVPTIGDEKGPLSLDLNLPSFIVFKTTEKDKIPQREVFRSHIPLSVMGVDGVFSLVSVCSPPVLIPSRAERRLWMFCVCVIRI